MARKRRGANEIIEVGEMLGAGKGRWLGDGDADSDGGRDWDG